MSDAPAPLPALDAGNIAFWTGGSRGELMITRCRACRRWLHLVDVEPDEVAIGMRVRARFEAVGDVWLPLFVPDGDAR
jgi:uncharacterized OB-fold protein